MEADKVLRQARAVAGLTLRELASRADTSHSALAAYEAGHKVPTVGTLDRIIRAAGFSLDAKLATRIRHRGELTRGDELMAVLELAASFPARHDRELSYPIFGPT